MLVACARIKKNNEQTSEQSVVKIYFELFEGQQHDDTSDKTKEGENAMMKTSVGKFYSSNMQFLQRVSTITK